ncbi:MAG: nucleotidyltransferase family protein [Thermodesulfobacteriota bacterium]
MRSEMVFLLHCAFPRHGAAKTAEVRDAIGADFDWEFLLASASHHGLMPHVWEACVNRFHDQVPAEIIERLQRIGIAGSVRNHLWAGELFHLLHTFEAAGIGAVPFKGPVLAEYLYGEPWLREISDLDVIVRRKDVPAAVDLIAQLGYVSLVELPKPQLPPYIETHTALAFVHTGSSVRIDLHWGLSWRVQPTLFDTEAIWDRLQTVTLLGRPVPGMCPEDLMIALCLHHSKDMWKRLIMVSDVARLAALHQDIEWPSLLSRADHAGTGIMLRMGLLLALDMCGIEPPAALQDRTRNGPRITGLVEEAKRRLVQAGDIYPNTWDSVIYFLKTMQKRSHQALFVLHVLAHPGLEDRVAMPPAGLRSILFRALRVCRLLKAGLTVLCRRLLGERRR